MVKKKDLLDKTFDYFTDKLCKLSILSLKFLWKAFKKGLSNIPSIRWALHEKIIFSLSFIVPGIYILVQYKLSHPSLFIFCLNYPWMKGMGQLVVEYGKSLKIKRLSKKYKRILEKFDNKLKIVDVKKDKITVFSNEITKKELEKNIDKFELYFSRKIAFIKRHKDFKYNDMIFFANTKFKKYYRFDEYLNRIEKIKNMELPIVLGIDQEGNILIADLTNLRYLFIAGEAGGGKSVLVNCIIQSLMVFTQNVIYILVDMKEGVELSDYYKFPNTVICATKEEFKKVISVVNDIMIERLRLIRETDNCKNIQAYNAKPNTKKMNYIVFVIDEIAEIKLNADNKSGRSEEENILLQILQKGRAAGVYGIGATQRPGVDQIDGSVRAGFQHHISFKVTTPETQRMTKIYGTEKLKTAEFKTNIADDSIYKGFLILEEADRGLPQCNQVYEDLKHVLVDGKFFVEIKEKPHKKNKRLLQRITSKFNKSYPQELSPKTSYHLLIKKPAASVITEIATIKTQSEIENFPKEMQGDAEGDNYKKILNFIHGNYKDNLLLPEVQKNCGISRKQKDLFLIRACEDGFIAKASRTRYKINLDCPRWKQVTDVMERDD